MVKRRQFLGGLTALAGSYLLSACGGGGSGDGSTGSTAKASASPMAKVSAANASANGTVMPGAASIIDGYGDVWTLVNGVIYRNGSTVGNTYSVSLVLWYGGKIWHCGTGGQFYVNADDVPEKWLHCSDPRIDVAPVPGSFYGMNGHADYTYTPEQVVSILKGMNCTSYRVGVTDDPKDLNAVVKLAKAFQSAGLTLLVLIDQGVYESGGLMGSESVAYNRGYSVGATVANALKPYGVTIYECGNELTRQDATVVDFTYAGSKASDFNNQNWPIMRGVMRGMIDGVKSAQPSAKCGINFCVADVGASDALWEGRQPDGSGGHPTVRWDVTTWHNYEVYGDLFNVGTDGAGPGFDLATYCKARYGVPLIVTEWNTGPEKSESYRGTYISDRLAAFYNARKTHNIQSVMYYVLDSGNNTYGIMVDGKAIDAPYNAFTSFTSGHADT